jgi:hypothetical protein
MISETGVDLLQKEAASVAGEEPSGEIGENFARTEVLKKYWAIVPLCVAEVGGWCLCSLFHTTFFLQ